jgi:hypothetical protein
MPGGRCLNVCWSPEGHIACTLHMPFSGQEYQPQNTGFPLLTLRCPFPKICIAFGFALGCVLKQLTAGIKGSMHQKGVKVRFFLNKSRELLQTAATNNDKRECQPSCFMAYIANLKLGLLYHTQTFSHALRQLGCREL